MKIQFIGATHEVTGSCTLLEVGGRYYLVDCGMEQGTDVFQNIPLPVLPSQIEAVFLTHAHIDHSGMLPKLYKDGFKGQIYATEATCNLCDIMLRDSAHIQESEAQWRSRKAERAGEPPVEPTYTLYLSPHRYRRLTFHRRRFCWKDNSQLAGIHVRDNVGRECCHTAQVIFNDTSKRSCSRTGGSYKGQIRETV